MINRRIAARARLLQGKATGTFVRVEPELWERRLGAMGPLINRRIAARARLLQRRGARGRFAAYRSSTRRSLLQPETHSIMTVLLACSVGVSTMSR